MKKIFRISVLICISFSFQICSGLQVTQEPTLGQTEVGTSPICFSRFSPFYAPWCYEGKPNSIMMKGVMDNSTGKSRLFLEYYLKTFETELPVGIALRLDNQFYLLKKTETSYGESLKIVSELSPELIAKIESAGTMLFSYSSRSETLNIEFSSGEKNKFLNYLRELNEKVSSLEKMNIQKI